MSGSLFDAGSYRQQKLADFRSIPERVWPTPVWLLHQGTDVLVYRNADAARGISRAQHRLFTHLAKMGNHPDAIGNITTLVCTGLSGVTFDRQVALFDHMLDRTDLRLAGPDEIERYIGDWFKAREGR